ncbi:MAG TPA: zinc metallopeptidase [Actinobacteria bacterium]|nr:zinc metallopeptidase [Actinomycetota bacterium]
MFFFSPMYLILVGPAMLLVAWAQYKVKSTYRKHSGKNAVSGMSGSQLARALLDRNGLSNISVQPVAGELTDHYDPKSKALRLSEGIFNSRSIAAQGIVAHEVGHALQDSRGYVPLRIRASLVPAASFGSSIGPLLVIAGIIFAAGSELSSILVNLGIIFFAAAVLFQIVTLPVEFNASQRALVMLTSGGYVTADETKPAKQVLNAAALTYVAATLAAVMQLVYFLLLRRD